MLPRARRCLPALALLLGACQAQAPGDPPTKTTAQGKAAAAPKAPVTPPPAEQDAALCNPDEVAQLTAALASADPMTHPDVVARGLADACQMPPFLVHYFESAHRVGPQTPPIARGDLREYQAVLHQVCPSAKELLAKMAATAPAYRTTRMFDGCRLEGVGLVDRAAYLARRPTSLMPFVAHQWLLDQGVEAPAALSIARAIEIFDRKEHGPLQLPRGLALAAVTSTLDPVPAEPTVYLSTDAVMIDQERVAGIESGAIAKADATDTRITALHDGLRTRADKGQALAASRNTAWEGRVVVAAHAALPASVLVSVLSTASQAGYERFALATRSGAFEWGVLPLEPLPEGATAHALSVHVDSAGFEVSAADDKAAAPERLGIRPTEGGAEAWDFAALAKRAAAHRAAHDDARVAHVILEPTTPHEVVVRTIVALRGDNCAIAQQCVLPSVALSLQPL